jgi:hypothetical protein
MVEAWRYMWVIVFDEISGFGEYTKKKLFHDEQSFDARVGII